MALFFSKRRRNDRFFPQCYKFREHHRRSVGVLWAFGGFLQTRFYNNAAKIFSAIIKIWTLYQYMPKRSARVARDMLFGRFLEGS